MWISRKPTAKIAPYTSSHTQASTHASMGRIFDQEIVNTAMLLAADRQDDLHANCMASLSSYFVIVNSSTISTLKCHSSAIVLSWTLSILIFLWQGLLKCSAWHVEVRIVHPLQLPGESLALASQYSLWPETFSCSIFSVIVLAQLPPRSPSCLASPGPLIE